MTRFYSIIVPVYNRPKHMQSLLECLARQGYKRFEVMVVESGSAIRSDRVVEKFRDDLDIRYIFKGNDGQGFSRNRGMKEAAGDYFVILDSDVLLPDDYLDNLDKHLNNDYLDAFGGPDKLHPDSSAMQAAVNFCMTSLLTTGGTRGKQCSAGRYYPRSFNMGVSRAVYEKTGGFHIPFLGEDLEWSHRIVRAGFKTGLISTAYVYHERKRSLIAFYQQTHFFGRARINVSKLVPRSFKALHTLPMVYCAGFLLLIASPFFSEVLFAAALTAFSLYNLAILLSAAYSSHSLLIGCYALLAANVLMLGYCSGMLRAFFSLYIMGNKQTYA